MLRDIRAKLKMVYVFVSASMTTSQASITGIDLQGFGALFFNLAVGSFAFDGSNKITVKLEESDDGTTYSVVAADDMFSPENGTIAKTFTAGTLESQSLVSIHYRGSKRYVRPTLTVAGAVTVPMSITAVKGYPDLMPPL